MKKRLLSLCLILALVLTAGLFTACGDSADTTPPEEEGPPPVVIATGFSIIRPAEPNETETDMAKAIQDALYDIDVNVFIKKDSAEVKDEVRHEIIIGNTSRPESADALASLQRNEYTLRVSGSEETGYRIVVAGNGEKALAAACRYFMDTYLSSEEKNAMPKDLSYSAKLDFPCENVQVMNNFIGDYTIVYAKEGVTSPVDPNYKTFIQTAKYKDVAEALADAIENATGIKPAIQPDSEPLPEGKPVILLGKTDHAADDSYYTKGFAEAGSYTAALSGDGTVILAGDNACAAYAAGEELIRALTDAKTNLTSLNKSGVKKLIKVACVGDSITHGTTSSDESAYNYPVYLQRMLGYDYYVEKYGAPGFSMTSTDTFSYMSYGAMYQGSINAKPDVVIMMLGTNDCNPFDDYKDWTNPQRANTFKMSAVTMINAYMRANKDVQIYMMTPPTVPQNADWANNVKTYAVPLVTEVAESKGCYLIDIYSWSLKNTKVFAGDGLHPKNGTYENLAKAVYDGLKDTVQKPE